MPLCSSILRGSLLSHCTIPRKSGASVFPEGVMTEGVGDGAAGAVGRGCTLSGPITSADAALFGVAEGEDATHNSPTRATNMKVAAVSGSQRTTWDEESGFTADDFLAQSIDFEYAEKGRLDSRGPSLLSVR